MSDICDTCYQRPAATGSSECSECLQWSRYWASLTPSERCEEDRMMADYVAERDEEGRLAAEYASRRLGDPS